LIIDTHVHLFNFPSLIGHEKDLRSIKDFVSFRTRFPEVHARMWREQPIDNSDELVRDMDKHGIAVSLVQRFRSPRDSNEDVAAAVRKHPKRLYGLARFDSDEDVPIRLWNDPAIERKRAPNLVRYFIEDLGMVGLGEFNVRRFTKSIHPEEIAEDLSPIMDALAQYKVPIQFMTAWTQFKGRLFYGNPEWVDEVAGLYPQVPIILTKMGRSINYYFDICLTVALRNVNVYFDISESCSEHLRKAVDWIGADRIMFGTDWSATQRWVENPDIYSRTLKIIEGANLTPDEREAILWRTAAKIFNLEV
jgi:predicted TIM-barrel fold metal-dependent hydrolase